MWIGSTVSTVYIFVVATIQTLHAKSTSITHSRNPNILHITRRRPPWKATFNKSYHFRPPCTETCKGLLPHVQWICSGSNAPPNGYSTSYVRKFSLKLPLCAYRLRKIDGGEGVPKCVICDGGSIFGVQFLTENFSHYNGPQYDHPCLHLNNSKIWRPTREIFSRIIQNIVLYKAFVWNPQYVIPFLGEVLPKTRHSTKVAIFDAPVYKC